jgi:hypothetical protein
MLSPCHYYAAFAAISIAEFIRVGRHFATTHAYAAASISYAVIRRCRRRFAAGSPHSTLRLHFTLYFSPMPLRRFSPPPLSAVRDAAYDALIAA